MTTMGDSHAATTSAPVDDGNSSSKAEFEVFLNFRGLDTRHNFTDCLYHSMTRAGIHVFRDNEEIRKGEKIGGELLHAIESSKIYVLIFSRNYASSSWCLRELKHMMECWSKENDKMILPIFYDVNPEDVKLKTQLYLDALEKHKEKFGQNDVLQWKEALTEVARIKGWDLKEKGHGEIINSVIDEVLTKLKKRRRDMLGHLVGLHDHVKIIVDSLNEGSHDARDWMIYGMGGPKGVKITIATRLTEMELTDHDKASLYEGWGLFPLLHMIRDDDIQVKEVAIKALDILSTLPKNGLRMIVDGAVGPLLDVLFSHSSSSLSLCETVAATIMHLAMSTLSQELGQTRSLFLESKHIFKLFSLAIFSSPNVQECILRTFHALFQSPCGTNVRTKLRQCAVIQALVQLCELERLNVRANAVKLLYFLVDGSDEAIIAEHVGKRSVETLLKIIRTSNDVEEVASAVGIIAKLPEEACFTEWLQDKGAFSIILNLLQISGRNNSQNSKLVEDAVGVICRFTAIINQGMRKSTAKAGLIPLLVHLSNSGTSLTKTRASFCLAQFSCSSSQLGRTIPKRRGFLCF